MSANRAIYDISAPIQNGMIVYEGDPDVSRVRTASIDRGDPANVSRLDFGVHTGTHIDAPVHFTNGAPGVEAIDLDALLGPVQVVDATHLQTHIDAAAMASLAIDDGVERVIFKTRNSDLWEQSEFSQEYAGLTSEGARALVERRVRLVGIDYLSISPHGDPAPTHLALLDAGIVILEGLDLRRVPPGMYELVCLPLLIPGSDGAPARAILRELP